MRLESGGENGIKCPSRQKLHPDTNYYVYDVIK